MAQESEIAVYCSFAKGVDFYLSIDSFSGFLAQASFMNASTLKPASPKGKRSVMIDVQR